jgi:hypothetical protein
MVAFGNAEGCACRGHRASSNQIETDSLDHRRVCLPMPFRRRAGSTGCRLNPISPVANSQAVNVPCASSWRRLSANPPEAMLSSVQSKLARHRGVNGARCFRFGRYLSNAHLKQIILLLHMRRRVGYKEFYATYSPFRWAARRSRAGPEPIRRAQGLSRDDLGCDLCSYRGDGVVDRVAQFVVDNVAAADEDFRSRGWADSPHAS